MSVVGCTVFMCLHILYFQMASEPSWQSRHPRGTLVQGLLSEDLLADVIWSFVTLGYHNWLGSTDLAPFTPFPLAILSEHRLPTLRQNPHGLWVSLTSGLNRIWALICWTSFEGWVMDKGRFRHWGHQHSCHTLPNGVSSSAQIKQAASEMSPVRMMYTEPWRYETCL